MNARIQAPAPPAAAAEIPASTVRQIVQSLRLAWTRNAGEAHIKLDPAQFGDLSIAMKVDRGQVVARLQAESPVVREWLHTNQDMLRAGLAEQHLRLDRLEIVAAEEPRDPHTRDDEPHQTHERPPQQRRQRKAPAGETFDIVA